MRGGSCGRDIFGPWTAELADVVGAVMKSKETVCNKDCFRLDELDYEDYKELSAIESDFIVQKTDIQKKLAARQKAYREANREKVAAYQKAYREANREKEAAYQKAYYEANREKLAAYQKAYREANREKVAAQRKAYREARL